MLGLIIKDVLFLKNSWKNLAITYILSLVISIAENNYLLAIGILPVMLITSGINAFQTDEFYLTESYALTFPVSRKKIVISRYLFTFIMVLLSTIISLLTYLLIFIFLRPTSLALNSSMIGEVLGIELICLFINIIFYPIIYKYGCEKSRYVLTSIIMIFIGLITIIFNVIDVKTIDFNSIITFFYSYGLLVVPIAFITLTLISYILSVIFFTKNDY